jgi:hypothetical protein
VSAGWGLKDERKDPDFDLLRRRDEFKKPLADLEKKQAARPARQP